MIIKWFIAIFVFSLITTFNPYLQQSFFALIIGAFSLGQAAPNMENLMTAAGASVSIYETIDRVSL